MTPRRHALTVLALPLVLAAVSGCGGDAAGGDPGDGAVAVGAPAAATAVSGPAGPPTFARDVAPIIYDNCTICHRPGEAGPFVLLSYDDARKRAEQIADVTADRYMPPWLPAEGYNEFLDARRLTEAEIDTLARWAEAGAPEGDPSVAPSPPSYPEGWQLGEPDLVVTLPEPYTLQADGPDVFRNFVIPLPVQEMKYVRAVEFRPGNAKVVHHAVMYVDRGRTSRRLDALDPEPGFPGMDVEEAETPDGHFLGWTPGRMAREGAEGTAWRLHRGTDLVLQLHLQPTGKPETIDPRIGLFFTDEAPTWDFFHVSLRNDHIIIPAGATGHAVEDSFTLPVDVLALSVYPHAHYLGDTMEAWAELPDGSRRWLVNIPEWDFNWQDEFRFHEMIELPAGTTLHMRYTYDNSADNVQNPNHPPERVVFGLQSTDEMATLGVQVVTRSDHDLARLRDAMQDKVMERMLADFRRMAEEFPERAEYHYGMGTTCRKLDRLDEAMAHLERALALEPGHLDARDELGVVHQLRTYHGEAIPQFEMVLAADPDHVEARYHLGNSLFATGRYDEAVTAYERTVRLDPDHASAYFNLGLVHRNEGRSLEAIEALEQTLAIRPEHGKAHYLLGQLLIFQRDLDRAAEHLRALTRLSPDFEGGHFYLAMALMSNGDEEGAATHFRETLRINPHHTEARRRLGIITGETFEPTPSMQDIRGLPPQ